MASAQATPTGAEAATESNIHEVAVAAATRSESANASTSTAETSSQSTLRLKSLRLPGQLEDRYVIHEKVGKGSFGIVHRVTSRADGASYAAKSLGKTISAQKRQRMLAEVAVWEKLSWPPHPCVLGLLEVVEGPPSVWVVSELMAAGELLTVVRAQPMTEQRCRMIMLQAAAGLGHLHLYHKYAHRDLKPANIICRDTQVETVGCVKIADFGFAEAFDGPLEESSTFTENVGTLDYYAPELVANLLSKRLRVEAKVVAYGPAVDCWALGCIAYELLHGEPPYLAADDEQQLRLVLKHELSFPDSSFGGLSAGVVGFIRLLLAPQPQMRMRIDQALRHPWLREPADAADAAQVSTALPLLLPTELRDRPSPRDLDADGDDTPGARLRDAARKVAAKSAVVSTLGSLSETPLRQLQEKTFWQGYSDLLRNCDETRGGLGEPQESADSGELSPMLKTMLSDYNPDVFDPRLI